jgi:hypothetical protein
MRGGSRWDERHTVTSPEGGKTTCETSDRTQTIRDGGPDGEVVSRSTWTERGPEREATVQQVFAQEGVRRAVSAAGTILLGWLSPSDDIDGQRTVMGFVPREYQPGKSGQMDLCLRWEARGRGSQRCLQKTRNCSGAGQSRWPCRRRAGEFFIHGNLRHQRPRSFQGFR